MKEVILIDSRPLVASNAGICNFLIGSVSAWATLCPEDTFLLALPRPPHDTVHAAFPSNVKLIAKSNPLLRHLPNLVWLFVMMPLLARRWHASIYYSPLPCLPFFLPKRTTSVIVIHDVVNFEYPDTMKISNILANKFLFKRSVRKAQILWTNSIYTKQKVEHYVPKRTCQNIFTGCAVNRTVYKPLSLSTIEAAEVLNRYEIVTPFILFVGSLEPRKNLSFLLSLMPRLYKLIPVKLVIVGASGWKNSNLKAIVEADSFPRQSTIFCGFIPDDDLAKLYSLASCFVSASINEGFGMPQLEALLCQCPVVTAHNSAMIELANGIAGATTVSGYNPEQWTETIVRILRHPPHVDISALTNYDWNLILQRFLNHLNISRYE